MPPRSDSKLAFYKEGYHMLLRDKEGKIVADDVIAWGRKKQRREQSAVRKPAKSARGVKTVACPAIALRGERPQSEQRRQAEQVQNAAGHLQGQQRWNQHVAKDLRSQALRLHRGAEDCQKPTELHDEKQPRLGDMFDRQRKLGPRRECQRYDRDDHAPLLRWHRIERSRELDGGKNRAHQHRREHGRRSPPRKVRPQPPSPRDPSRGELGQATERGSGQQAGIDDERERVRRQRDECPDHNPARVSSGCG